MDSKSETPAFSIVAGWLVIAVMLAVLPDAAVSGFRDVVRAGTVPGQIMVQTGCDWTSERIPHLLTHRVSELEQNVQRLQEELQDARLTARRAQLRIRTLQSEIDSLHRHGTSPFAGRPVSPFIRETAVEARVLGAELIASCRAQRLLNHGSSDGLAVDHWVLDQSGPVIDAGADHSLSSGLPVFSGRCIVGRISETGHLTSLLELITAPSFRAHAAVMRETPQGLQQVGTGLLTGEGSGRCRLAEVGAEFEVARGDVVYSTNEAGSESPMVFGLVTSATLDPGALHWDVTVRPAADLDRLRNVQIVIPTINPDRLLGQR